MAAGVQTTWGAELSRKQSKTEVPVKHTDKNAHTHWTTLCQG